MSNTDENYLQKLFINEAKPALNRHSGGGDTEDAYNSGYTKGKAEGVEEGKKSEYDTFWDVFQKKGNPQYYNYAFAINRFTNTNYKPKYDIVLTTGSGGSHAYYYNESLTDTLVPIHANPTIPSCMMHMFSNATRMQTIRKLVVYEITEYTNTFHNTLSLKNILFEGTIGRTISFVYSPLTVDSMKNIISCLKDYSGTDKELTYTLSFTSDCWATLETDSTSPIGTTWKDYVGTLGWLT